MMYVVNIVVWNLIFRQRLSLEQWSRTVYRLLKYLFSRHFHPKVYKHSTHKSHSDAGVELSEVVGLEPTTYCTLRCTAKYNNFLGLSGITIQCTVG